jgi:hypothetical protein
MFIPFDYLDDMISAGVLVSFILTNCSLIVLRRGDSHDGEAKCATYIVALNAFCFAFACTVSGGSNESLLNNATPGFILLSVLFFVGIVASACLIYYRCPEVPDIDPHSQYRVPWVPFTPSFGIFINYVLLAQLSPIGLSMIVGYFGLACLFYFGYGIHYSKGNNTGWREVLRESSLHRGSDSTEGDERDRDPSYHRLTDVAVERPTYTTTSSTSTTSKEGAANLSAAMFEVQEDGEYKNGGVVRNVIMSSSINGSKYSTLNNHDSGKR